MSAVPAVGPDVDALAVAPYFPLLDSLRAVGALAVFTTHVAFWSGSYIGNGAWGNLLARLNVGVAIFFVLSGFLLSRPYLVRALLRRPAPALGSYYLKRFLRIVPLYVVTAVLALTFVRGNADLGLRDWLVTLVMGNTFVDTQMPDGLTHMWSLAVEVTFYALLPLLMLIGIGRSRRLNPRRILVLVLMMTVVSTWWELSAAPGLIGWSAGQPSQWLPSYLAWFGTGILLALLELLHRDGRWSQLTGFVVTLARQPGSCWMMAGGLLLVAATPLAGPSLLAAPTPGQLLARNTLFGLIGALIVLTGVFAEPGSRYAGIVGHRRARHLGLISYGFFCLHLPVLHLVMWLTGWQQFAGRFTSIWIVALLGSLLAAEVSYRLIEVPVMRVRNLRRSRAASTTAPTTGTSTM